jgi:hypothetical protein
MPSFSLISRQATWYPPNDKPRPSVPALVPLIPSRNRRRRGFGVAVLVAMAFLWERSSTAAEPENVPVATIRVHDYAQIPTESMVSAQQLVTDIYDAIGVRTRWLETIRPMEVSHVNDAPIPDPKELLVIVLSPSMSQRQVVSEDTVGMAVVTRNDGGHIAYVLFDRVRRVAGASTRDAMDVMGLVMAHEVGHLLLPHGSHSRTGLMRPNWDIEDLQTTAHAEFEFTSVQAELIREALRRSSGVRKFTGR